jgi:hypothetical protein
MDASYRKLSVKLMVINAEIVLGFFGFICADLNGSSERLSQARAYRGRYLRYLFAGSVVAYVRTCVRLPLGGACRSRCMGAWVRGCIRALVRARCIAWELLPPLVLGCEELRVARLGCKCVRVVALERGSQAAGLELCCACGANGCDALKKHLRSTSALKHLSCGCCARLSRASAGKKASGGVRDTGKPDAVE